MPSFISPMLTKEQKENIACVVELLNMNKHRLGAKDRKYAESLITFYYKNKGIITHMQRYWLGVLAQKSISEFSDAGAEKPDTPNAPILTTNPLTGEPCHVELVEVAGPEGVTLVVKKIIKENVKKNVKKKPHHRVLF